MSRRSERRMPWSAFVVAVLAVVAVMGWLLREPGDRRIVATDASSGAGGAAATAAEESANGVEDSRPAWSRADVGREDHRLSGRVLMAVTGEPVAGAEVRASAFRPRMEGYELFRLIDRHGGEAYNKLFEQSVFGEGSFGRARSGADGRFVLDDLGSRRFYLLVDSPAGYQTDFPWLDLAGGAGDEEQVVWLVAGASLRGTALDSAGVPVAGAEVELFSPMNPLLVLSGEVEGFRRWQARTDAAGRFAFEALPLQRPYTMTVRAAGFARHVERSFVLQEARVYERTLRLSPGAVLRGRVESTAGGPLAKADVIAMPMGPMFESFLDGERRTFGTYTDDSGEFTLAELPAARLRVYFSAAGHVSEVVRGVHLRAGVPAAPLRIRLQPGAAITGRVVDDREQPVADVRVRAMRPRVPGAIDASDLGDDLVVRLEDRSDAGGRFAIDGLGGGRWNLDVQSEEHAPRTVTDVAAGDEVTIVLERRGGLRGRVVDLQDRPVERFRLLTRRGFLGIREEQFDAPDGRFELPGLSEGRYQLTVQAPGHATALQLADVPKGAFTEELRIVLEPEAEVHGVVRDVTTGEPVAGAELRTGHRHPLDQAGLEEDFARYGISVEDMPRTPFGGPEDLMGYLEEFATVQRVRTDPSGAFHLRGLPRRPTVLEVTHPFYRAASTPELPLDQQARVDAVVVTLDPGGALEGRVRYDDQSPVPAAMMVARHGLTGTMKQTATDEAGEYALRGLRPGVWTVVLMDLDLAEDDDNLIARMLGRMQPASLTVRDGETLRHDVTVPRLQFEGATVSGVVRSLGRPLDHGMVTLAQGSGMLALLSGRTRTGRVEADGRYEVRGVVPGRYEVRYNDGRELAQGVVVGAFDIADVPEVVLDLALPVGRVSGRLVQGAEPVPVTNDEVRLVAVGLHPMETMAESGRDLTDDRGEFVMERVPAGRYRLVLVTGRATERLAPFQDVADVELHEGQDLDLGTLVVDAGGAIAGVVTGADGLPAPGVVVRFRRSAAEDSPDAATWYAFSAEDGRYRRPGLAAGIYEVEAVTENSGSDRVHDVRVASGAEQWVPLLLALGVDVKVRVLDGEGSGVTSVQVVLRNVRGDRLQSEGRWTTSLRRAFTGASTDGGHEFLAVPPGVWTILVNDATGTRARQDVTVTAEACEFTVHLAEQEPP